VPTVIGASAAATSNRRSHRIENDPWTDLHVSETVGHLQGAVERLATGDDTLW
jgi:hypothetical protein